MYIYDRACEIRNVVLSRVSRVVAFIMQGLSLIPYIVCDTLFDCSVFRYGDVATNRTNMYYYFFIDDLMLNGE